MYNIRCKTPWTKQDTAIAVSVWRRVFPRLIIYTCWCLPLHTRQTIRVWQLAAVKLTFSLPLPWRLYTQPLTGVQQAAVCPVIAAATPCLYNIVTRLLYTKELPRVPYCFRSCRRASIPVTLPATQPRIIQDTALSRRLPGHTNYNTQAETGGPPSLQCCQGRCLVCLQSQC
ncbi:hypothetical protein GWK47_036739 [Chionoecetes opilio]|uniref:Uncharacterized protein n=1 Tax=Chionoecetes opilio TaxID=41210 RepID=A0A8J4YM93_CHIOP|nr:hypothetical protein GWK47_036739 [Chionoecetes opilio]